MINHNRKARTRGWRCGCACALRLRPSSPLWLLALACGRSRSLALRSRLARLQFLRGTANVECDETLEGRACIQY